jgi:hypothetical protein
MHLDCGVSHPIHGLGIVVDQNPDCVGDIKIKFECFIEAIRINPESLQTWPTDANGRLIQVNDLILYPIKGGCCGATIGQGVVTKIGKGVSGEFGIIDKITIKEDRYGHQKCHKWPEHCIVIDSPVIKKEED